MNEIKIYALVDPETNEPFYVGSTKGELEIRLRYHVWEARAMPETRKGEQSTKDKKNKIKSILSKNKNVSIICLYKCSQSDSRHFEQYFYELFKNGGLELLQSNNRFFRATKIN